MIRTHLSFLNGSTAMTYAAPDDGAAPAKKQPLTTVDVGSEQSGFGGSIVMGQDGTVTTVQPEEGNDHIEVGAGAVNDEPKDEAAEEVDPDAKDAEGEDDDGTGEDDTDADDKDKPVELPEFKADDPEVVAAYETTFKTDGKLDMQALSRDWWANQAASEDGTGHLTEGVYEYLDSLGIPKELVKTVEDNQVIANNAATQKLYAHAGGKENLDAAISWATKNGYTKAQQDAFNKAVDAGGSAATDAIDLLMTRHTKATDRRASPKKSLGEHGHGGEGGDNPAGDVFKTKQEWIDARHAAGRDNNKQAEVSAKYRRSPGALKW